MSLICPIQSKEKKKDIAIIYLVTSGLSILGASSVIIFSVLKRIVRSPEVHPLFHLALADLILASLWFAGACRWFQKYDSFACFYLDVVAEMAHLASFFLTVNYGLNAYIRLRGKTKSIANFQLPSVSSTTSYVWSTRILYALCWLVPVAIMLPLLLHVYDEENSPPDNCTRCLLLFDRPKPKDGETSSHSIWKVYGSIALVATLAFSIVALMVVYFLTVRTYRKAVLHSGVLTDLQRVSIDAIRNKVFLYILVFLLCWSPALVVASCDIAPSITITNLHHWFLVFLFQGFTAPMQGFFNCIVYGWARKNFREAPEQRKNLLLESEDNFRFPRSRRTSYGSLRSMTSQKGGGEGGS